VAETLIRFLDSLSAPVLSFDLCSSIPDNANLTAWCKQAFLLLTPSQFNCLVYLLSFLREILQHSSNNMCTADQLGSSL
jgi:hypothetical protein